MREFLYNVFRVSSCELTCACGPMCMRYRSGEINNVYGYVYKCMFVFVTANESVPSIFFLFSTFKCFVLKSVIVLV